MKHPLITTIEALDLLDQAGNVAGTGERKTTLMEKVSLVCADEGRAHSFLEVEQAADQVLGGRLTKSEPVLTAVPATRKGMVDLVEAHFLAPANNHITDELNARFDALEQSDYRWLRGARWIRRGTMVGGVCGVINGSVALFQHHLLGGITHLLIASVLIGYGVLKYRKAYRDTIFLGENEVGQLRADLYQTYEITEDDLDQVCDYPDLSARVLAIKQSGRSFAVGDWAPIREEMDAREQSRRLAEQKEAQHGMWQKFTEQVSQGGPGAPSYQERNTSGEPWQGGGEVMKAEPRIGMETQGG